MKFAKLLKIIFVHRKSPRFARLNLCGGLIRRFRIKAGWTQEQLAAKLQVAGWDIDRVVVTRIETGQRTLFDYEVKYFLDVFGKSLTVSDVPMQLSIEPCKAARK